MLKHAELVGGSFARSQPPSGGCVLKPMGVRKWQNLICQPPSGGCVLKLVAVYRAVGLIPSRLQAAVC